MGGSVRVELRSNSDIQTGICHACYTGLDSTNKYLNSNTCCSYFALKIQVTFAINKMGGENAVRDNGVKGDLELIKNILTFNTSVLSRPRL